MSGSALHHTPHNCSHNIHYIISQRRFHLKWPVVHQHKPGSLQDLMPSWTMGLQCSDQASMGRSRKLSSIPVVWKKVRDMINSAKLWGSFFNKWSPRSDWAEITSCVFSLGDRDCENRARVANSGLMYHECRVIIFRPTVCRAWSSHSCRHWISRMSFIGASVTILQVNHDWM